MYTFDSPWVHHPCSSQAVVEGARDGVTTTTSRQHTHHKISNTQKLGIC